jgi:probable O-glycosylation ligase (exosortase A-associated)
MLRAIFVIAIIIFGLAQSLRGAFYTLLFYLWFAYFRPDAWVWYNFVSGLNLSLIVGVLVVVRTLFSGERPRFGLTPLLLCLFLAQSFHSTLTSDVFPYAWPYFIEFTKIITISLLMVTLVCTEARLRLTLLVMAVSLGFESTKQGWAQFVLNPGAPNVNEVIFLGDNNGVAVGMFMLVPIIVALARTSTTWWEKLGHRFVVIGVIYRGISTYSRGGFLAASALGLHYVLRSRRKVVSLLGIALVVGLIAPVLPDTFWDRMSTIPEASEEIDEADGSIRGRMHFWEVAVTMANDRPWTGVGHNAYNAVYDLYDPSLGAFRRRRSVHSAWFGTLSELGYPGLILYVSIFLHALWQCWRVGRMARTRPELKNLAIYAGAIEAGLIAFAVGATFVPFQYNEMLWHFFALSTVTAYQAREKIAASAPAYASAPAIFSPQPAIGLAATNAARSTPLASR